MVTPNDVQNNPSNKPRHMRHKRFIVKWIYSNKVIRIFKISCQTLHYLPSYWLMYKILDEIVSKLVKSISKLKERSGIRIHQLHLEFHQLKDFKCWQIKRLSRNKERKYCWNIRRPQLLRLTIWQKLVIKKK